MTERLPSPPLSCSAGRPALLRALLLLLALSLQTPAQDCEWEGGLFAPQGTDGTVHALAEFSPTGSTRIYAGGEFAAAGDVLAPNVAVWDGSQWDAVGGGTNGPVSALAVFNSGTGDALYAAGEFTTAGGGSVANIARWSGSVWSALGGGVDGRVLALTAFNDGSGDALYAGGEFSSAEGITVHHAARWNGNVWLPLGDGLDATVRALEVYDSGNGPHLYAGGDFLFSGNTAVNSIARWNGASWVAVGAGVDDRVTALEVFTDAGGDALFAAGEFVTAGGLPANRIARWDGSTWSALGFGVFGEAFAMEVYDGALHIGGVFDGAGAAEASNIASWDGLSWSALDGGTEAPVHALLAANDGSGNELFAGGEFSAASGVSAGGIAAWDGATWRALGSTSTVNGPILDAAVYDAGAGPSLFVCGEFTEAAGTSANFVAQWTGSQWLPAGGGMDDLVLALEVFDDGGGEDLYAAGIFARADGLPATRVARFDQSGFWSAVGTGIPGAVFDLETFDDGSGPALFAGGFFNSAGGVTAANVAKWQGGAWSDVGGGTNTVVRALAVLGNELYAAGDFASAGGVSASRVARWNGSSWSPLGTGLNDRAFTVLGYDGPDGPSLYVGGSFTAAGGLATARVARWDGSAWARLDTGVNGAVLSLFGYDDGVGPAVYAGGEFTSPGSHLARWDGATWAPLATQVNGAVSAFALFDDGAGEAFYAAGEFSVAGSTVSTRIARRSGPSFPVVTNAPDDDLRCVGAIASFSAAVDGTPPFAYQWRHNGEDLPGAQQSTLVLPNVQAEDDGEYDVVVSDACGVVVSDPATLTVRVPASITAQPQSQLACVGNAVILSVAALGSEPLTYAWRRNGFPIEGADSDLLVIDPITQDDAGLYECVVTNECNVITSQSATLTLAEPVNVVGDPGDQTSCPGTGVILSVGVAGSPPFTYQWRKDGTDLKGENADLLIIDPVTLEDAGAYDVSIVNVCGEAISSSGTLSIDSLLEIYTQPTDQTVCPGGEVSLQASGEGAGDLQYQWSRDGAELEGETAAVLTIASATPEDAGSYQVAVSDDCDTLLSDPATVTIRNLPAVLTDPADRQVCPGGSAVLETLVSGSPPLELQWFKDGTPIAGAQSPTLSIPTVTADEVGQYLLRVTNDCASVESAPAVVTLLEETEITTQPTSEVVCRESTQALVVEAIGSEPLNYQWRLDGIDIEDATDATYTIEGFTEIDVGAYDVEVSGPCGTLFSLAAILTLEAAPVLETVPGDATVCRGTPVLFEISASGTEPLSYQWRKDGEELPGATETSLAIASAMPADAGVYDVAVTNACGTAVSDAGVLAVLEPTTFTTQPSSEELCFGAATVLGAFVIGSEPLTYQWRKDGQDIPGATEQNLPIPSIGPESAGTYELVASNDCATVTSDPAVIAVGDAVELTTEPEGGILCEEEQIVLSTVASGTPPFEFQWRKDGIALEGETAPELVLDGLSRADSGSYSVVVSNLCTTVTSGVAVVRASECFHRGDVDSSGDLDISDGIAIFNLLFLGRGEAGCLEAADVNNDGDVDLSDGIHNVNYLFLGGIPPIAPGPPDQPCGVDPDPLDSPRDLGCERYTACP